MVISCPLRIAVLVFFVLLGHGVLAMDKLDNFGSNPGNLKGYIYLPSSALHSNPTAIVIALHGCSQTAEQLAEESGWNTLAEGNNFVVIYPEQKLINNGSKCFNWFLEKDVNPNDGELASIWQMLESVRMRYATPDTKVFVYGLSAGAIMGTSLLANFPESIDAGAILAGGPYGLAGSLDALRFMRNPESQSPEFWVKKLPHLDPTTIPRLIVGHGTKDKIVAPQSSQELIKQWCGWTGLDYQAVVKDSFSSDLVNISHFGEKPWRIKYYEFVGLGHALPVNPGKEPGQGGKVGMFTKDFDFHSTFEIAKDFGLLLD